MSDLLNVREAAKRLGVHENTIRNWANNGVIRHVRLPGSGFRRIPVSEIERLRELMLAQETSGLEAPNEQTTQTHLP